MGRNIRENLLKNSTALFLIGVSILFFSCARDRAQPIPQECTAISFSQEVLPLINQHCISCHYQGSASGDLSDYIHIKQKVDDGSMKQRVVVQKDMPGTTALSITEIQKIKCWIEQGAQNN